MRVTNSMMSSRMLLNINKNMRNVDSLYNQIATTKKINYPSDNPILASRALKFRSMVTETEQYQRNVSQGLSWMELTDYAFGNVIDILKSVSELSVKGASDQHAYDDRQKIASSIEQYLLQLSTEVNVTYAGRYVFSGYRTDQPATFAQDAPNARFDIKQSFAGMDIESIKSYQKLNATQEPLSYDADILKLAYKDIENGTIPTIVIDPPLAGGLTVTSRTLTDPTAYTPGANDIYVINETGELVLGANISAALRNGAELDVTYRKTGFAKSELNPRVYFECTEYITGGTPQQWNNDPSYTMDDHRMQIEIGVNTRLDYNSLSKNMYTDKLYADLSSLAELLKSVELSDETLLRQYYIGTGITDEEALTTAVNDQLTRERQRLTDIIQNKYSNMIGIIQRHSSVSSTQRTDLGTRMNRLDLVANRLVDDRLSYKKLLSDNEDTDMVEVSYLLNEASAVYQASLQAGAGVIQLTLANFIR